ncbi:MAG: hypothetical protein J4G14_01690 [Dehalococcoidia bacterium]|nr:hypothetical protein [Dehalococcoidia bacterium]
MSKPSEAAADETFLRDLHWILKAWFGKRSWLIIPFDDTFKKEVRKAAHRLDPLSDLNIADACWDIDAITGRLWDAIDELRITGEAARLVSGSKAIHHLLPELAPPIDNEYSGKFSFYDRAIHRRNKGQRLEGDYFKVIFPSFVDLAQYLNSREDFRAYLGRGYNTSVTKTVDNAIIGYMEAKA